MSVKDPNEPIRVKDKDTGHEVTIRRVSFPHGNYQELKDVDATDANGEFLPPKFAVTDKGQKAAIKKETDNG